MELTSEQLKQLQEKQQKEAEIKQQKKTELRQQSYTNTSQERIDKLLEKVGNILRQQEKEELTNY